MVLHLYKSRTILIRR